eukprot:1187593-Prymnesium_polylepis.1
MKSSRVDSQIFVNQFTNRINFSSHGEPSTFDRFATHLRKFPNGLAAFAQVCSEFAQVRADSRRIRESPRRDSHGFAADSRRILHHSPCKIFVRIPSRHPFRAGRGAPFLPLRRAALAPLLARQRTLCSL